MSFVDIVASALICVVALLILWLQFIDPLGYIPGRRSATGDAGQQGGGVDGKSGAPTTGLHIAVLAAWDAGSAGEVEVNVDCSGDEQKKTLSPKADNYAAASFRFPKTSNCTVAAAKGDLFTGAATVHVRAIVEGKRFYQLDLPITVDSPVNATALLSQDASQAVWSALGEPPRKSWAFRWSKS
jgi:hypothetical protein